MCGIDSYLILSLRKLGTDLCDETNGWITARITNKDSSVGYHEFANTSKTWCLKVMEAPQPGDIDECVQEGTKRITFGRNRTDFAAAVIELLANNVGTYQKL